MKGKVGLFVLTFHSGPADMNYKYIFKLKRSLVKESYRTSQAMEFLKNERSHEINCEKCESFLRTLQGILMWIF